MVIIGTITIVVMISIAYIGSIVAINAETFEACEKGGRWQSALCVAAQMALSGLTKAPDAQPS